MANRVADPPKQGALWRSPNGILLAAALISSAIAWWMIALPVATLSNEADHAGHFALTFSHMIGGTGMLFLGGLNLYLAARRDRFQLHRKVGQAYLLFGMSGAILAMIITLSPAHKPAGSAILTNSAISLLMLASAWLAFAALGWRAAKNKRFQSHGQWMIRSYVLVWSFVFCRIASRVSNVDELGGGEAFIWLSWVGPLIVCEMLLQWPEGSRRSAAKATTVHGEPLDR